MRGGEAMSGGVVNLLMGDSRAGEVEHRRYSTWLIKMQKHVEAKTGARITRRP